MRPVLLVLPVLLAPMAQAEPAPAPPVSLPGACQRQLVFLDDFRKPVIEPRNIESPSRHGQIPPDKPETPRWIAHTPWNGDFGDATFADPGPFGPFSHSAEGLAITASRDPSGRWRSGLIAAADGLGRGFGVRYGYFEARMKLPPGPGTWPAFWLMSLQPAQAPAPAVEIDALEYYGHDPAAFQVALHVWYRGKQQDRSRQALRPIKVAPGALVGRWHDYGVAVGPAEIVWYLDRTEVWRAPTPPELTGPLYPLVNLALGSGYPVSETPNPSVLALRYLRVYRDVGGPDAEGCAAPPAGSALAGLP